MGARYGAGGGDERRTLLYGCAALILLAVIGLAVVSSTLLPDLIDDVEADLGLRIGDDFDRLEAALASWASTHEGAFPERLDLLVRPDERRELHLPGDLPVDPWGRSYGYERTAGGWRLWSLGKDGAEGGRGLLRDWTREPAKVGAGGE